MTIAAGFHFDVGVLVCADTQFSSPSLKFHAPKLSSTLSLGKKQMHMVFAMSGTDGYMQTAIESCEQALCQVNEDQELDESFLRETLQKALVAVYGDHFYPHPRYGYTDGPQVELIVGVLTDDSDPMLFSTQETTVTPIYDYRCIGSGGDLATQVLKPLIISSDSRSLRQTVLLATHALKIAKESDPSCGGISQFAIINRDGFESPIVNSEIDSFEAYSKVFQGIMNDLFYAAADIDNEAECISKALTSIQRQAREIREEQKASREKRERLIRMLGPSEQSASQGT